MNNQTFNTAICCIAKCENHYLKEWADYHLSLGFSHIYIYDNNDEDGEKIAPLCESYDNVIVLDCRGKVNYQKRAYTEFYRKYGNTYDWIAYIDVDEFITFNESTNIKTINEFLHTFDEKKVDVIQLNWMLYGDNDLVCTDSFSVLDRFVKPLAFNIRMWGNGFDENNWVKSIYRGGLPDGDWYIGPHTCHKIAGLSFVDDKGEKCKGDENKPYDFSIAYVRHFYTKTIVEWIIKKSRGRSNGSSTQLAGKYSFDSFFDVNVRTEEKERMIKCYEIFKDVLSTSENLDLAFVKGYREELEKLNKEKNDIWQRYDKVLRSKAYRLGKLFLKPFTWFKLKKQ